MEFFLYCHTCESSVFFNYYFRKSMMVLKIHFLNSYKNKIPLCTREDSGVVVRAMRLRIGKSQYSAHSGSNHWSCFCPTMSWELSWSAAAQIPSPQYRTYDSSVGKRISPPSSTISIFRSPARSISLSLFGDISSCKDALFAYSKMANHDFVVVKSIVGHIAVLCRRCVVVDQRNIEELRLDAML